jgi:ATP-binding cassette subfamily B protein
MLLRLVRTHLRPYRRQLAIVVGLQFVGTVVMLYLPKINADIIDKGIVNGDTGYILRHGGLMLAVSLLQIVCSIAAVWFSARTAMAFGRDVRAAIFHRVGSFSAREVQHFGAPSLITRETNDVQQVQMLVLMGGTLMVASPIMMVGGIIMALNVNAGLAWLVVLVVPVLATSIGFIVSRMVPSFRLMQERVDEVNRLLREQITGVRVVRAFVREERETDRFAVANGELTDVATRAGRYLAAMFPVVMLVANVASVGVLWFGGHRVDAGEMQVGALTAYLAYLMQIVMAVMMGTFMMMMLPRATVCADRVMEVLDTETSVPRPTEPVTDLPLRGTLELDGVELTYPGADAPVLRDITFRAEPGQTVAVIGSTGAGKSTLVNLVPRLFDVTAGELRVDGVDVRRLAPERLWSVIGLIPQRAYLFSGTVRSNLMHGKPDATDEEMWAALEIAQAADFVREMGNEEASGLDAPIAQGGTNVSGGQRQRLAIARAVVKRPEIYLFDDSFSALDLATDARLRAALRPVTRNATVLIVAQRVSTIRDADVILVLEDGVVVDRGTHQELLASSTTYQEIVASQLSAEEAA